MKSSLPNPKITIFTRQNKLLNEIVQAVRQNVPRRLHVPEDILRMVGELIDCTFIDMETNLRTHSPEMGSLVYNYIRELDS